MLKNSRANTKRRYQVLTINDINESLEYPKPIGLSRWRWSSMAACIHPSCPCKTYEDSKSSKSGTLLHFLGCHTCGHKAAEHRRLTASDRFIQSEIAAAASSGHCSCKIPTREVPSSVVFGKYDVIPLSIDSDFNEPEQESGVQCACSGFQFSNIVRLWQKFRTHSTKDIEENLQLVPCFHCQHPFSDHKVAQSTTGNGTCPTGVSWFQNLSLKCFAKLKASICVDEECVQVLMPSAATTAACKEVVLVVLQRSKEDDSVSSLLVYRHTLQAEEGAGSSSVSAEQPQSLGNTAVSSSQSCNGCSLAGTSSVDSSVSSHVRDGRVPSRKRNRGTSEPHKRRSQRLANASKKRKMDEAALLRNMEELRVNGKPVIDVSEEAEFLKVLNRENKVVEDTVTSFVKSLQSCHCERHAIPKELKEEDLRVKLSACCVGTSNKLLVALGKGKTVFVSLISRETKETGWIQLKYEAPSGAITFLSWFAQSEGDSSNPNEVNCKLCAGTTSGVNVHLWSAKTSASSNSLVCSQLGYCKNTDSRLVVGRWSPNGKLMCVGTALGEVLFYSVDSLATPAVCYLHLIECCKASVRTLAWSEDSCAVAVGGSDDCIQLLQCRSQQEDDKSHVPCQQSILKYVRGKQFSHTHTLRGHQSFIADVQFLSTSTSATTRELLSVGWDGQVLLWTNLAVSSVAVSGHHHHPHPTSSSQSLCAEADPQLGFKIGPSMSVEFLPLSVHVVARRGLVLTVRNRVGGISLVCYFSRQSQEK